MWPWLAGLGTWLTKLIGGWLPIGTKPIGEWLGKIIWVSGIFLVGMILWNKFTKPTSSEHTDQTIQAGGQAIRCEQTNTPRGTFGCVSLKVYEYYQKEKPKEPVLKEK